jgi:hypothetical protein
MKLLMLAFFMTASIAATAQESVPGDFIAMNVTVKDYVMQNKTSFRRCAKQVCRLASQHGDGSCGVLEAIGVITTVVTDEGADAIERLACVKAVEDNQESHANPRIGRGN